MFSQTELMYVPTGRTKGFLAIIPRNRDDRSTLKQRRAVHKFTAQANARQAERVDI